jgi:hypothetical protein
MFWGEIMGTSGRTPNAKRGGDDSEGAGLVGRRFYAVLAAKWLVGLLLVVGLLLWQLPRLRQYNSEVPTVIAYVITGVIPAILLFGTMKSTGMVKGKRFGTMFEFGGSAALAIVVTGGGLWYESKWRPTEFAFAVYFHWEGKSNSLVEKPGKLILFLDEPKEVAINNGYAAPQRIPAKWNGQKVGYSIVIEGLVEAEPHGDMVLEPDQRLSIALKEENSDRTALAKVFNVSWARTYAEAQLPDKATCRFVYIFDPKDALQVMSETGCAIQFNLQVSDTRRIAQVDEIRVKVHEYRAIPEYKKQDMYGAARKTIVCYVEIDDPRKGRNTFPAKQIYKDKGDLETESFLFTKVDLEKDKPETFFVKVNALTPGIYKLSFEVVLVTQDKKETVQVGEVKEFLFDRFSVKAD